MGFSISVKVIETEQKTKEMIIMKINLSQKPFLLNLSIKLSFDGRALSSDTLRIDLVSSPANTYKKQEHVSYNERFGTVSFHPINLN